MRKYREGDHRKRMDYLRTKLLKMRKRFLDKLQQDLSLPVRGGRADKGDSSGLAPETDEGETATNLAELDATAVGQIDEALEKVSKGTYGICEKCGERIGHARLKVVPFASLCIRCKEAYEAEGRNHRCFDQELEQPPTVGAAAAAPPAEVVVYVVKVGGKVVYEGTEMPVVSSAGRKTH